MYLNEHRKKIKEELASGQTIFFWFEQEWVPGDRD